MGSNNLATTWKHPKLTDKLVLHEYYFLDDYSDRDFDTWYQLSGLLSMLCYLVASLRYYGLFRRLIVQVISNADHFLFRWIRNFLFAFLLMLVIRVLFFLLSVFIVFDYWATWWYYFSFAIIFYYIAITGYANSIESRVAFTPNLVSYKPVLLPDKRPAGEATAPEHPVTQPVSDEGLTEVIDLNGAGAAPVESLSADQLLLKEKITALLAAEKIYEDPELSLAAVARKLGSNVSLVSKVINQGFGMNFNDLVNQHRVTAVLELFSLGEHRRQTLLAIAFEVGFNSKATFNRAFKKVTGRTPKDYLGSAAGAVYP